jgi:rod shape-determining protein MreC
LRNLRANRLLLLAFSLFLCITLMFLSVAGFLAPVEQILATPLNLVSGVMTNITLTLTGGITDIVELRRLQERNADLEEALALLQAETVDLREKASDYDRMAALLNYTTTVDNQEFVAADVISVDQSSFRRTITINRGARDGIRIGMPVVTEQGLVGQVRDVSAGAARVLLITDRDSAVSARLQGSRAEGSVRGQTAGNLRMMMIDIDEQVQVGDLAITSGLGGNFPADIVIGVVVSRQQFEFELSQEAEITSFNNFDSLEMVLVITSFQPVDLSVFEN